MLHLDHVTKIFDSKYVLRDVTLRVGAGEIFVLVGPSGAGKSVTLKLLSGIIKPDLGKVHISQQNLHAMNLQDKAKLMRRMGMLFQKNALFDSLTCFENVAFPLRETTTENEAAIAERVMFFLEAVGLASSRHLFPEEISGGMQKRLGIARALALKPEIVFYDDPTAGLDPITSRSIIQLILKLRKENNSTVVAITNDMNRAFQMADQIGMITDGELIITGSPSQTRAHLDPRVQQFITGSPVGPLSPINDAREFI
jgi:phospholipid/cholesterol/gamma-HCH transport system ATP-binding protein